MKRLVVHFHAISLCLLVSLIAVLPGAYAAVQIT